MALAPLAHCDDLDVLGVDTSKTARVELALAAASSVVRDAAGSAISHKTSTFTITGRPGQYLDLPVGTVGEVASVEIDGTEVGDFRLVDGALWRRGGWSNGCVPSLVTVVATHGSLDVPPDIVLLVCELAAAGLSAAEEGIEAKVGVQSERIDDYSVTYEIGSAAMVSVMELPERTRQRLKSRFGGGVHVVAERP